MAEDKFANVSNTRICYRTFGSVKNEPLVMITGLSMQLTDWPMEFISTLSKKFYVIVHDNRDSGLSKLYGAADSSKEAEIEELMESAGSHSIYTLMDMAEDTIKLMDYLNVNSACVLGFSMGGIIAQLIASTYSNRVGSLISLMSFGGEAILNCTPQVRNSLKISMRYQKNKHKRVKCIVDDAFIYKGKKETFEISKLRAHAYVSVDRSYCPNGTLRQAQAIISLGNYTKYLERISVPTLIIHGEEDPCIQVSQAKKAHDKILNSKFISIPGIGHSLSDYSVSKILKNISENCQFISKQSN